MTIIQSMMASHPKRYAVDLKRLAEAISASTECTQVCTACADACLAEDMVIELRRCIRLNLDCVEVCSVTARMLSRQTEIDVGLLRAQLETCVQACKLCSSECERHAGMHEHCKICSETCRRCEQACQKLLEVLSI